MYFLVKLIFKGERSLNLFFFKSLTEVFERKLNLFSVTIF